MEELNLDMSPESNMIPMELGSLNNDTKITVTKTDNNSNGFDKIKSTQPNLSVFTQNRPVSNIGLELLTDKKKTIKDSNDNLSRGSEKDLVSSKENTDDILKMLDDNDFENNDLFDSNKNVNVNDKNISEIKYDDDLMMNLNSPTLKNDNFDFFPEKKIDSDNNSNINQTPTQNNTNNTFGDENYNNPKDNAEYNTTQIPKKKTFEEIQKEKQELLFKFVRLEQRGIHLTKKFSMSSNYEEMKDEYERLKRNREIDNSIKFQRKMLMAFSTGAEFLNNKFDPFDVKLDGWSENVHESISDYDEIFEDLHEKYKEKAQMAPELKLLMMVGGSAFMFHLTNTMFKSSLPGMGDIMKQNPELMKQFASAAVNTMGQQNPGFSNFMGDYNEMKSNNQHRNMGGGMPPNMNMGGGMSPNMNMGGGMPPSMNMGGGMPTSMNMGGGMPPNMNMGRRMPPNVNMGGGMTGPSGVDDILNGLNQNDISSNSSGGSIHDIRNIEVSSKKKKIKNSIKLLE